MGSTDSVNFSIRQNKAIERQIVFDGLARLLRTLDCQSPIYLGFGSVWFVDFVMAHRRLGIQRMFSIEADDVIYERAKFNRPYRTIEVLHGLSTDAIPALVRSEPEIAEAPWIVWLDYDQPLGEDSVAELGNLAKTAPSGSILLTTFNAASRHYGKPRQRYERIWQLFGDATPDNPFKSPDDFKDSEMQMQFMARAAMDHLIASALDSGREDHPLRAYSIAYQDGSPMVTVGIVLCPEEKKSEVASVLSGDSWHGMVERAIVTPPLTQKEVSALESCLPSTSALDRDAVRSLGFDLLENQLDSFVTHYLNYPTFAQISR